MMSTPVGRSKCS